MIDSPFFVLAGVLLVHLAGVTILALAVVILACTVLTAAITLRIIKGLTGGVARLLRRARRRNPGRRVLGCRCPWRKHWPRSPPEKPAPFKAVRHSSWEESQGPNPAAARSVRNVDPPLSGPCQRLPAAPCPRVISGPRWTPSGKALSRVSLRSAQELLPAGRGSDVLRHAAGAGRTVLRCLAQLPGVQ